MRVLIASLVAAAALVTAAPATAAPRAVCAPDVGVLCYSEQAGDWCYVWVGVLRPDLGCVRP